MSTGSLRKDGHIVGSRYDDEVNWFDPADLAFLDAVASQDPQPRG